MYDQMDISWDFWTYKKMETMNSLHSIKMPQGWQESADALLRRSPVRIPAIFYDYLGEGVSYGANEKQLNQTGFRMEEKLQIGFVCPQGQTADFAHGKGEPWEEHQRMCLILHEGEWVNYTLHVSEPGMAWLETHMKAQPGAVVRVAISADEEWKLSVSDARWHIVKPDRGVFLQAGRHQINVMAEKGDIELEWLAIR